MKNPVEPCDICGDIGFEGLIMTCFNCREAREHIYCATVRLRSVPDMWLCQVCRSSAGVLQISNSVKKDIAVPVRHRNTSNGDSRLHSPPHGLMLLANLCPDKGEEVASLVSNNDTSPVKKHRPHFLAFPSPKRKRRTLRLAEEDSKETKAEKPQSSSPCVFHQID